MIETAIAARASARPAARVGKVIGWATLAAMASLGLSAVFVLPVYDVLIQSVEWVRRASSQSLHRGVSLAQSVGWLLASLLPPQGDLPAQGFPLQTPRSAYVGSVLWAPALYALLRVRGARIALIGVAGIVGLLAGAQVPGIFELIGHLPLLSVSVNTRLVFVAVLAQIGLAALGIDAWRRRGGDHALADLAAALVLLSVVGAFVLAPRAFALGLTPAQYRVLALWCTVPLASSAGLFWIGRRRPGIAVVGLLAILVVQRLGDLLVLCPTLSADLFFPRVAPVDALPEDDEPYRVVGNSAAMLPNSSAMWEIEDPRGYQVLHNRRFVETWRLWSTPQVLSYNRVDDLTRPFLSLMNVRFALVVGARRPRGWKLGARGPGADLLENEKGAAAGHSARRARFETAGGPPSDRRGERLRSPPGRTAGRCRASGLGGPDGAAQHPRMGADAARRSGAAAHGPPAPTRLGRRLGDRMEGLAGGFDRGRFSRASSRHRRPRFPGARAARGKARVPNLLPPEGLRSRARGQRGDRVGRSP